MGWQIIYNEKNKPVGIVGDKAWDLAEEFLNKLNGLYLFEFGRKVNEIELESIIDFVSIEDSKDEGK